MSSGKPFIVIFGAGPGISHATAERFGREGYSVVLVARNTERLEKEVSYLRNKGLSADWMAADVADEASLAGTLDRIGKEHGDANLVLYNAAVANPVDILEETWQSIHRQMDVNVGGAFTLAKHLIPRYLKHNAGKLFFTGGGFALQASADWTSLSLGKAALRSLVQALATRVKDHDIHVATLTICGFVSKDDPKYSPDQIAEQYWRLFTQPRGKYTWEVQY